MGVKRTIGAKAAVSLVAAVLVAVPFPQAALAAFTKGDVSVTPAAGQSATAQYKVYQVFRAQVANGMSSELEWASAQARAAVMAAITAYDPTFSGNNPQDAAEFIRDTFGNTTSTTVLGSETLGEMMAKELVSRNIPADATLAPNNSYKASLDEGFVLIVSSGDTSYSGTSPVFATVETGVPVDVREKTSVPSVAKKVSEDGSNWVDASDAQIGVEQRFQITGTIPSNIAGFSSYRYKFTDNLSGLELKTAVASNIKVSIDGKAVPATNGTTGYTASYANDVLTIDFPDVKAAAAAAGATLTGNSKVVVEYLAALKTTAAIGETGNRNSAKVSYERDPQLVTQSGNIQDTPEDTTDTYTYEIDFTKLDHSTKVPVADVTFTLKDSTGAEVKVSSNGSGSYVVDPAGSATITSSADGTFKVKGLDAGNYTLTEKTVPQEYAIIEDPLNITITTALPDYDGDDVTPGTFAVATNVFKSGYHKVNSVTASTGTAQVEIHNDKLVDLPETGRFGSVMIGIGGAAFLGAGIVVAAIRIRRRKQQDGTASA